MRRQPVDIRQDVLIENLNENSYKIRVNLIVSGSEKHYHSQQLTINTFIQMIVCLCRNVKTSQIVEAVKGGARSVDEVGELTGAATCCGKCQFMVNAIVTDHSDEDASQFYNAAASA